LRQKVVAADLCIARHRDRAEHRVVQAGSFWPVVGLILLVDGHLAGRGPARVSSPGVISFAWIDYRLLNRVPWSAVGVGPTKFVTQSGECLISEMNIDIWRGPMKTMDTYAGCVTSTLA